MEATASRPKKLKKVEKKPGSTSAVVEDKTQSPSSRDGYGGQQLCQDKAGEQALHSADNDIHSCPSTTEVPEQVRTPTLYII